jgi:hypothetical protein
MWLLWVRPGAAAGEEEEVEELIAAAGAAEGEKVVMLRLLWCSCCSVLAARSRGGEMAWFAARTKERGAATDGSQVDFLLGGEREMW